ncbi:MAG: GtrA family protein [Pseudomonadota bacterium]
MPLPRFVRFLLVGLLNTGIGYALFTLFTLTGFSSATALGMTYVFGVISNFFTTGRLVFGTARPALFLKFVGVYLVIYLINLGLLGVLTDNGINKLLAQAALVPFMAVLSYVGFRHYVFKES